MTDAWTSPNSKAYIAVMVHFKLKGKMIAMLLDIVKVAKSHSGTNLAAAFAKILEDFGISHKVSHLLMNKKLGLHTSISSIAPLVTTPVPTM